MDSEWCEFSLWFEVVVERLGGTAALLISISLRIRKKAVANMTPGMNQRQILMMDRGAVLNRV
jgi:hypothetical protein